jgi:hypothetical protein
MATVPQIKAFLVARWRHFVSELILERPIAALFWKRLLLVTFWQYLHKVGTNVAYYLHRPGPALYDTGFELVPKLAPEYRFLSEIVFLCLFVSGLGVCVSPLFIKQTPHPGTKRLYAVICLLRFFTVASVAQTLRVISFLATLLPGPAPHCQPGSKEYMPPEGIEIFTRLDALKGCGDLIFSSHTIFVTICVLSVQKYVTSPEPWARVFRGSMWALLAAMFVLVIAARKHYTVDVVIALYVTPLLWYVIDREFPDYDPENDEETKGAYAGLSMHDDLSV